MQMAKKYLENMLNLISGKKKKNNCTIRTWEHELPFSMYQIGKK